MKNFMTLMKSNPVVTASVAVLLICILCLFLMVRPKGASLTAEMKKRSADQSALDALMRTSVTVPAQTADGQPVTIQTTVNRSTIDKLEMAFGEMKKEYDSVFNDAEHTNRRRPMIEDPLIRESIEQLLTTKQAIEKLSRAKLTTDELAKRKDAIEELGRIRDAIEQLIQTKVGLAEWIQSKEGKEQLGKEKDAIDKLVKLPALLEWTEAGEAIGQLGKAKAVTEKLLATTKVLDQLLPKASSDAMRYNARARYKERLLAMFGRTSSAEPAKTSAFIEDTLMEPRLNAGSPPAMEELQAKWDEERKLAERRGLQGTKTALSETEEQALVARQREIGLKFVQDYAKRITVYADTNWDSPDFPLHVPPWVRASAQPEMAEIFEGQMSIWIQEDILRAITMANREGQRKSGNASVVSAPVKRLLRIRVLDDYVGSTGSGGVQQMAGPIDSRDPARSRTPGAAATPQPPYARTGPPRPGENQFIKVDSTALAEDLKTQDPDQRLREGYNIVPSGRISNVLYDVRHAIVEVVVDYKQLPLLFNALGKVNFMTVLNVRVEDVDEHTALRSLMVLGESDCVQVRMLVETIWMRKWTTALMPEDTRKTLGIIDAPVAPAK